VVAQLEGELGVELLVRHPRGVTLTDAGQAFLVKARAVLAAEAETAQTALALRRAASDAIAIGFVGPPPPLGCPDLFGAFEQRHPQAQISFLDLPFPRGHTSDWLADVDAALCLAPMAEPGLCAQAVRVEPRALVAHRGHPLAGYRQLAVSDVLDETFVSYHPEVQSAWAAFHSLDDHRGGPPLQVTGDHVLSTLQMLGIMSSPRAITTVPHGDAKLAEHVLPNIVALPLEDAAPAAVSLLWREDASSPLLEDLLDIAARMARSEDEL
jgi:DNA-binding transcriptional LysR family regulator